MRQLICGLFAAMAMATLHADESNVLRTELEPLQFLAGWCWEGAFPDGKQTDTHCFEPLYGGAHLRDRHVVTGGPTLYQGEAVYSWSGRSSEITFVYWNSNGGVSMGTAKLRDDVLVFPDETYLGSNGEVVTISATWENIAADGYDSLTVETYQNGEKKERRVRYEKRLFVKNPSDTR